MFNLCTVLSLPLLLYKCKINPMCTAEGWTPDLPVHNREPADRPPALHHCSHQAGQQGTSDYSLYIDIYLEM